MIRALHTVAALDERYGGPSRSVPALCDSLASRCEWIGLATQAKDRETALIRPRDERVHVQLSAPSRRFGAPLRFSWNTTGWLSGIAKSNRVNLVHDHGVWLWMNHAAASTAATCGVPRVVSPRGMLMRWPMSKSRAKKAIASMLYQRADLRSASGFVATSRQEAEEMLDLRIEGAIAIIPNGVAAMPLPPRLPPTETRRVAFLSRIHPKKGLITLIEAWASLRPAEWTLAIGGPSELGHEGQLREIASRLGIAHAVQFVGPVADVDKWNFILDSDLMILPSESENFGMIVAEALEAGRPVIATQGTPWSDLVEANCGWWPAAGREGVGAALAEALALDRATLMAMGQRGRILVRQRYSWDAVGARMAEYYRWILNGGTTPEFIFNG